LRRLVNSWLNKANRVFISIQWDLKLLKILTFLKSLNNINAFLNNTSYLFKIFKLRKILDPTTI
jgi:hypothetical protein